MYHFDRLFSSSVPNYNRYLHYLLFLIMSQFIKKSTPAALMSKKAICWFKSTDMRLIDHSPFTLAHKNADTVDHIFVLDPRHYQDTKRGIMKANYRRLNFQIECLNDLSSNLAKHGCLLSVFVGEPEVVIPSFCQSSNLINDEKQSCQLYCHDEVCDEELKVLKAVKSKLLENCGVQTVLSWGGGTLFESTDLPFPINGLEYFTGFRKAVEQPHIIRKLKKPLEIPTTIRPSSLVSGSKGLLSSELKTVNFPILSSDIPQLWNELRNNGRAEKSVGEKIAGEEEITSILSDSEKIDPRAVMNFVGGETSAWSRIEHYIRQGDVKGRLCTYKETRNGMVGSDYSTKLSPYLSAGCITSRSIYDEIKKFETSSGISNENTYWVVFELLWRDYMRFYAMKYGNKMFFLGGPQGLAGRKKYSWNKDPELLNSWITGQTGYPLIDGKSMNNIHTIL